MSPGVQSVVRVCFFPGVLLLAAAGLYAAPDPDLFDGRAVPAVPQSSEPGSSEVEGLDDIVEQPAGGGGSGKEASESRDFSQIDGVSAGQPVSAEHSKSDTTLASGGAVANPAKTVAGAGTVSGGAGDTAAAMVGANESGGGAGAVERRFEDFSFGATGGESDGSVVVNRSKDVTVPSPNASAATVPADASASASGNQAAGSTPTTESGSGDYGSHVPSGL